jgi:hypothetical protein
MQTKKFLIICFLYLGLQGVNAQIAMPQPSPLGTVTQKVGLTDVTIVYSRPSAKGRKVFGDVVPYGELWRTGANKSVKFSISDSVLVGGKKIGKGDYSIFTIPGEKEWTIIINKAVDLSGTNGYKEADDLVRFTVAPSKTGFTESFTFNFANLTNTSADVELSWEETKVSFKIEVTVDDKVMKNIDAALNPSANSYFGAARYYYETERDSKQALAWINKALEIGGDKYWILRVKSLIQARLEDYKGAVETAEKSKALALADDDGAYVKMNETSIAEWTPKINTKTQKNK